LRYQGKRADYETLALEKSKNPASLYSCLRARATFFSSFSAFFSFMDLTGSFFFSLRASCALAMIEKKLWGKVDVVF
jgi:hypothetical protein